jgi:hypothetical protein
MGDDAVSRRILFSQALHASPTSQARDTCQCPHNNGKVPAHLRAAATSLMRPNVLPTPPTVLV